MLINCIFVFALTCGAAISLVFDGGEGKTLRNATKLSPSTFTVEATVVLEGGQQDEVVIVGLYDDFFHSPNWLLGLRRRNGHHYVHFTFKSDWDSDNTTVYGPQYTHLRRLVVTAVFHEKFCQLFVDGSRFAQTRHNRGALYLSVLRFTKSLIVGARLRGAVESVRVWNRTLSHREIYQRMAGISSQATALPTVSFLSSRTEEAPRDRLTPSPCGFTVCDDPRVIIAYGEQRHPMKVVRAKILNIHRRDGRDPIIPKATVHRITRQVQAAFLSANVSFVFEHVAVRNDELQRRPVSVLSPNEWRASKKASQAFSKRCRFNKLGDGVCDPECNNYYRYYDRGDCCLPKFAKDSCIDPDSENRMYLKLNEFQDKLNISNRRQMIVVGIRTGKIHDFSGSSRFPWEQEQFSRRGQILIGRVNNQDVFVHEVGHTLGLWHTHRGVSDEEDGECAGSCRETEASLVTGDLCADTPPTPISFSRCHVPKWKAEVCQRPVKREKKIPQNFMSYSNIKCKKSFTRQQIGRMHCYLDNFYRVWRNDNSSATIPLRPQLLSADLERKSVSFSWFPPLDYLRNCHDCPSCDHTNARLTQFAAAAILRNPAPGSPGRRGYSQLDSLSSVEKVIGPPDLNKGIVLTTAWQPLRSTCSHNICILDLKFQHQVIPQRLQLRIKVLTARNHKVVVIGTKKNYTHTIGHLHTDPLIPYTIDLSHVDDLVEKISLEMDGTEFYLDSVQLDSVANHSLCANALQEISYQVLRSPPFDGSPRITKQTFYRDSLEKVTGKVEYRIRVLRNGTESFDSLPLAVNLMEGICGDGKVNRTAGERCDDGNRRDGDGCSSECQLESGYICKQSPSLCYRMFGDGVCENFELSLNSIDCQHKRTPEGMTDQWSVNLKADSSNTSLRFLAGEPSAKFCRNETDGQIDCRRAWCRSSVKADSLNATFKEPVFPVSVLVSISQFRPSSFRPHIAAVWIGDERDKKGWTLVARSVEIACVKTPIEIPILHDLSRPMRRISRVMLSFSSEFRIHGHFEPQFSIAGIALRSRTNPLGLYDIDCGTSELVEPFTLTCTRMTPPHLSRLHKPRGAPPKVPNGIVQCKRNRRRIHECAVSCNIGYKLAGPPSILYILGRWLGRPVCIPQMCPLPRIPNMIIKCKKGVSYRSICQISCPTGFHAAGQRLFQNTIRCSETAIWTTPKVFCMSVQHLLVLKKKIKKINKRIG